MMKGKLLIFSVCVAVFFAANVQASVFSGSGGSSLQSVFNRLGYDYIDVANYQTDLNFKLQGMMEFQLLSKSGALNMSFGVLESQQRWWGTTYKHNSLFGNSASQGASAMFNMDRPNTTYSFYIQTQDPVRWWKSYRYYSYSPFNQFGAVQALFYQDPLNSGSYLLAFEGMYVGNSHSDRSYDDMVVRMSIHAAPEPSTWVMLASGLVGLVVLVTIRRRQIQLG